MGVNGGECVDGYGGYYGGWGGRGEEGERGGKGRVFYKEVQCKMVF